MKGLLKIPFGLLSLIFGKIHWQAPTWLLLITRFLRKSPWFVFLVLLSFVVAGGTYYYVKNLPGDVLIKASVSPPDILPDNESSKPDSIEIRFEYDFSLLRDDQPRPDGTPSVARIDLIDQTITSGVSISPPIDGQWQWRGDRALFFTPHNDWAPGTEYEVTLGSDIFVPDTKLLDTSVSFEAPELSISVSDFEFYQDPTDRSIRRVIATLRFSHPVDQESLAKSVSLTMRNSGDDTRVKSNQFKYELTFNKSLREAYLQSQPIDLPDVSNYMALTLKPGVRSLLGGQAHDETLTDKVLIPDIASFLKVDNVRAAIVSNASNQPEQVVFLELTDEIEKSQLQEKLEFYLLPNRYASRSTWWYNAGDVTTEVLAESSKLSPKWLEIPRESSDNYSFVFDVPESRQIYVRLNSGLESVNGFKTTAKYDQILQIPDYPREVAIAGEGSVLVHSGDHKLSVSTRGLNALRFSIGQVMGNQLNHLVSQTSGDISSPHFNNWYFDQNNISKVSEQIVTLNQHHPKELNYASLDLSQYLRNENQTYGLFFVSAYGYDNHKQRDVYGVVDSRLILVTDLGVIVKANTNNTRDVFVQSIVTGEPISGARVELLGKNGIAIQQGVTDQRGHLNLSSVSGFYNEKQPVVYVVKHEDDVSFIPYDRRTRQINLSKFDIGGVHPSGRANHQLNSFIFTDRGIYRPGETANIGFVVKRGDLQNSEGMPLQIEVTGPRYNTVRKHKLVVPKNGFFDYPFTTEPTDDTGEYTVSLYVLRDNRYRGEQIGSETFKIEEFQPDTMKIASQLVGVQKKAWSTDSTLTAKITLENLFGIPAQDRRTEGRLVVTPASFNFKEYKDYIFSRVESDTPLAGIDEKLVSKTTDADGIAEYELELDRFNNGTYQLRFLAEGFDQSGGRSVKANNQVLVSPLDYLVGYKPNGNLEYINKGSDRSIEFIAVDNFLNQVEKTDLILKLKEIRHVSTLVKQANGTYQYQTVEKEQVLVENEWSIHADGSQFKIASENPGNYALEIYDGSNRRLSRAVYNVVGSANLDGKIDKNAELQLQLEKADYKPGDIIEMNIKAPYHGAGLITIETDRVHEFKWFKTDTQSTLQTIRVPSNLEGTAYVNVAFVRDVSSNEIFTSPLSYAVQPFSVDRSKREINVDLEVDDIVHPGKPMTIGFSTNKPAKIAVFAIDEGILQVANHHLPKPLNHFLKKRALGVQTMQIMDLILPEFSLLKSLSAAGGGASRKALARNLNPFARKTDKPAVFWSGIVDADESDNQVQFVVPDTFSGALRVMAVAVSESAMGAASESTIVRGPFVLTPNVLLQAAPGDEFKATIGVANIIEGSGKQVPIKVSVSSSEHLILQSDATQVIAVDEGGESSATFSFKVAEKLGSAEVIFDATYNDISSSRSASLSVRPATPYTSDFISGYDKLGKLDMNLSRTLFAPLSEQSVSASTSPLVMVEGLSDYLEYFPHGCTEQVVSQVFPLIGMAGHPHWSPDNTTLNAHLEQVILKLRQRQQGEGGFSFWPGGSHIAEYPSIYATHFLLEAKAAGFTVPTDILNRLKNYLNFYVGKRSENLEQARIRAIAIYLLTRMDVVTTNYLVELQEFLDANYQKTWHKDLTSSYLAATYQLLKKDDFANELIEQYQPTKQSSGVFGDFDSQLTQDAQHIWLLATHFPERAEKLDGEILLKFIEPIFEGRYNTISASYSILALGAYTKVTSDSSVDSAIEILAKSGSNYQSMAVEHNPFATATYDTSVTDLTLNADKSLYYLNVQTGYDKLLPERPVSDNLEIYRAFYDENGKEVSTAEQGAELTATLRIRTTDNQRHSNIAVVDLLPGGFEVIRSSVDRTAYNWRADYIDIREDRVVYYGSFDAVTKELTYNVKVTAAGKFTVPPSYAESMYNRSVKAVSAARDFVVTPASP